MLIKDCIYCIAFLLSLFSVIALIYSIKNNNKYVCKSIIVISILYIIYMIVNLYMESILYIPVGMEILLIYLFAFISGILYIITIILNLIKIKKLHINTNKNEVLIVTVMLLIFPVLFLYRNVLKEKNWIDNSNLIVVYNSRGNGGIGDGDTFAYAIGEKFCEQVDLGIDIGGFRLKEFLPENSVELTNINDIANYKIIFNEDDSVFVYKDNKKICKINNKTHYFNVDFKKAFYIKH